MVQEVRWLGGSFQVVYLRPGHHASIKAAETQKPGITDLVCQTKVFMFSQRYSSHFFCFTFYSLETGSGFLSARIAFLLIL